MIEFHSVGSNPDSCCPRNCSSCDGKDCISCNNGFNKSDLNRCTSIDNCLIPFYEYSGANDTTGTERCHKAKPGHYIKNNGAVDEVKPCPFPCQECEYESTNSDGKDIVECLSCKPEPE